MQTRGDVMVNGGYGCRFAVPQTKGASQHKDAPLGTPVTLAQGLASGAARGSQRKPGLRNERVRGTTEPRQAVVLALKPFFTLAVDKRDAPGKCTPNSACVSPQRDPSMMDQDFIERTLRERRSLPDALADMLAKYSRIPSGIERSMLERMIEALTAEIALRHNSLRAAE